MQFRMVGLISPEEYDAELERMNVAMMAENQALQYDNKQLNTLIKEYETTLETVMGLFRQRAVRFLLSINPISVAIHLEISNSHFLWALCGGLTGPMEFMLMRDLFPLSLARCPMSRTNAHPRIRIALPRTRDRSPIYATRRADRLLGITHARLGAPAQRASLVQRRS